MAAAALEELDLFKVEGKGSSRKLYCLRCKKEFKQPLRAREHIIGGSNQTKKCVYKYDTEQLGKVKALHSAAAAEQQDKEKEREEAAHCPLIGEVCTGGGQHTCTHAYIYAYTHTYTHSRDLTHNCTYTHAGSRHRSCSGLPHTCGIHLQAPQRSSQRSTTADIASGGQDPEVLQS